MKLRQLSILIALLVMMLSNACVSKKKLTYLQYSGGNSTYEMSARTSGGITTPPEYKVMPYDNLFIRVVTPDPQWSELFNIPTGMTGLTQESASLAGYSVDIDGNIEIPFVGKVKVGGKSLSEIKIELDSVFKNYVTDASITVRLVNNYISVIGEVNSPGRYHLTKDRVNIFEAISLGGDLSNYSDRQKIQLIRPSQFGPIIKEFSLSDRSILSSEFYYVMPNDIIYAMPLHGRSFNLNTSIWTLFLTTITSAFGLVGFIRTL